MDINLLKKEKKDSLKHDETNTLKKAILDFLFSVGEITLENKSESKKIMPLLEDDKSIRSNNLSNSKLGINEATEMDGGAIDEDFMFVDEDIWHRLVNPWTLYFRSAKREETYFRTVLLPTRVLLMRLTSITLILLLIINVEIVLHDNIASTLWTILIVLACVFAILTWVDKGKYYIELSLESTLHRTCLFLGEVIFWTISHPS